jgi:hypothetical protein
MAGHARLAQENPGAAGGEEEEDYMSMNFDEPEAARKYEPSARKAARLKKEVRFPFSLPAPKPGISKPD